MAGKPVDRKLPTAQTNIPEESRQYFEREAYIARTPSDPRHLNPVFPAGASVVCVGCGGGWEGEAEGSARFAAVDIDPEAGAFRLERSPSTEFHLASGEKLPFGEGEFTFYMARGCIMYMDIPRFFAEAYRVLAPGGAVWFTCHDFRHEATHWLKSLRRLHPKDLIYRTYIILNGLLYHLSGRLIRFPLKRSRIESFQTVAGIRRGLAAAGFSDVQFPATEHGQFLVIARKPA